MNQLSNKKSVESGETVKGVTLTLVTLFYSFSGFEKMK